MEERGEKAKMYSQPKVCPNCSGYGLLFKTMHVIPDGEAPAEEKLPLYYPERQIQTVSMDSLRVWETYCRKQIEKIEAEKRKFLGGIKQIEDEAARRIAPKSVSAPAPAPAPAPPAPAPASAPATATGT
jgi:hypothetical protein